MITPAVAFELAFPGWDPVALHLGPLQLRWYGLGYLFGFVFAGWALDRLGKSGWVPLSRDAVSDLIGWLVAGVLVGGRLGYALFYDRGMLTDPLQLLRVWTGGLSFHGGLLGVVIALAVFARRRAMSWRRLADACSLAVPVGITLVRCANFVNAELYGRIAPAWLPWAVRFPTDPVARLHSPDLARAGGLGWHGPWESLVESGAWPAVAAQIPLRHPSQLYEALLEGVVTGAIVWTAYLRGWSPARRPGHIAALFLLCYAAARFTVEFTRQPDAQLGTVLGPLTMGQLLSLGMVAGAALILAAASRDSNVRSPQSADSGL